ncbi:MAG: hypothetical protein JWN98_2104 [Abditibacteriota bacterium]|nr:hypothetical protein [Abditibacteriota bacterium]
MRHAPAGGLSKYFMPRHQAHHLVPPRLRTRQNSENRRASWLELFYDLVFVAAIQQLAGLISHDYSFSGIARTSILFATVWWAWIGQTYYLTRFDTDDMAHRLSTMLQMAFVVAMAAHIPHGLEEHSTGFALSYAGVRLVIVFQYWRAGVHVPEARELTTRFGLGFFVAALLWILSSVVAPPWRFVLWGVAVAIDLLTPITAGSLHARVPPHFSHLPERFGLFTIILLGEAIVSVVNGSEELLSGLAIVNAALALIIAFALWWLYFDTVHAAEEREVESKPDVKRYQFWLYMHLPLTMGITIAATGAKHIVSLKPGEKLPVEEGWLICSAFGVCLLCLNFIFLNSPSFVKSPSTPRDLVPQFGIALLVIACGALTSIVAPMWQMATIASLYLLQIWLSWRDIHVEPAEEESDVP